MSLNVGELVGYLRLDMGDFESGMAKGQALADKLDGKNIDVKVEADTGVAEAKLAAVAASEAKVDDGNKKIATSGNDAGRGMGALVAAVLLLGPALVPLLAGAAGLAVGFGAMGAAGILAVVGISQQMKAGTPLGLAYTGMLSTLKGDLTTLGQTAASGTLAPFQQAVADLQTKMPVLNGLISEFSGITGKTAGALVSGLVAAFISLAPLARDAGVYILGLSTNFAAMMSGPGVVSFGDYVRSVFPQVMQAVESIVGAALHLVAALAPLGMGTLSMLKVFSDVISALPVDVLATLAPLATAVFIGFKSFSMLSGGITAVGTAIKAVGISAETAATGMLALNIAAGAVGALVTIAMLAFTVFSGQTQQATQATNDYADALKASNGVIDENIRQMTAKKLSDSGALDAARQLGLSLPLITDAALGNKDAMAAVTAVAMPMIDAFNKAQMSTGTSTAAFAKNGQAAGDLMKALGGNNTELQSGVQKYKDLAAATTASTATVTPAATAQDVLAAKVGTTSAALVLAAAGQKATADAAANATAKMYLENDAAGLLKQALDLLNGKTLSLMEAQTADADATNKAAAALKANKSAIEGNSAAAILNQQALQQKAEASQREAEAVGKATGSTTQAIAAYKSSKTALEGALKAQGLLTPAVQAYIDKLYDIKNLKLTPTKLDVDKAAAEAKIVALNAQITAIKQGKVPGIDANTTAGREKILALQREIDALRGKTVTVTMITDYRQIGKPPVVPGGGAMGGLIGLVGRAGGGQIIGPGTSTSDSITGVDASGTPIVRVSRDEFVVNAAAYAKNKALVNAINAGTNGFAGGGPVSGGSSAGNGDVVAAIQSLEATLHAELERQARTIQTMQRQYA